MKCTLKRLALLAATMVSAAALLSGCSGDDGAAGKDGINGIDGINGTNGVDGKDAQVTPGETCVVCHGDGKSASVDALHASSSNGDLDVTITAAGPSTTTPADLVVTFNVKVNGVAKTNYDGFYRSSRGYALYRLDGAKNRSALDSAAVSISGGTNGDYTITIPGAAANLDSRYLLTIWNAAEAALADEARPAGYRAIVLFDYPAAPVTDLLGSTSTSCEDCHGGAGNGFHYGYPAYGGKTCVVCHDAANTNYPRLVNVAHGIHNSANMPTGKFTLSTVDGADTWDYSIAFPSYMDNCSICHQTGAPLTAANSKTVDYNFCMTCHQNWDGFTSTSMPAGHVNYTAATNCNACHSADASLATVGGMHNAAELSTGNGGLLYDGVDVGVVEGAKIEQKITGVTRTDDKLAITWTATYDGAAVNPCNATPTATAPSFAHKGISLVDHGAVTVVNHNFSILKGFFQGDDVTNANNGNTSPGQPNSTNVDFTAGTGNTACVNNVATTTVTLTAKEALLTGKGRIGLQGKPVMKHTPTGKLFYVRAKSPVYDYNVADGSAAAVRRTVADTDKCLKCHIGSLYQHGGNRIDSVELCVMCHNEASSDQNNRVTMGVTASEAYDGKVGQTYGFKSMLHAVHASGEAGQTPYVLYRTRGIYAFAPDATLIPNWITSPVDKILVYGGDPAVAAAMQPHNFITAHYPRNLNDCSACHPSTFSRIADQSKAAPTTVDAGAAPWDNQLDDTLMGATTAACTSCHRSAIAMLHAEKEGFAPSILEAGWQTILDLFN
jgi:OmcA/MtrC family decaheme c-type cytochrome